ncbi:hypothetical protein [Aliarcobacter butzleri]|uniref:hypothetical protein n=1 Tax=Aliarcobacter butzleri TaxID=28197 RepID=UPI00126A354A|nr:hypothetical protein [Aliarcobacter butzleri]
MKDTTNSTSKPTTKSNLAKSIDAIISIIKINKNNGYLKNYKEEYHSIIDLLSKEIIKEKENATVLLETTNWKGDPIIQLDFGADYKVQLLIQKDTIYPSIIYNIGKAIEKLFLPSILVQNK